MEFDKPSTKYLFIGLGASIIAGIAVLSAVFVLSLAKEEAVFEAEKQACKDLKVKFLDAVKIKESDFYKDQIFYVAKIGITSAELQFPFKSHENIKVRCLDIEQTEDPYAGYIFFGTPPK